MREVALTRFAEQLSWDTQATRYLATWNRLLAKRRTPIIPKQRSAADADSDVAATR
jgi:hypothetical protein